MLRIETETGFGRRRAATALAACALILVFAASASAAAPNWLDTVDLSQPGRNASNPTGAMDAAGNTLALWERQSPLGPSYDVQFSTRALGGLFAPSADLTLNATNPQLATTPAGEAVAVWKHFQNSPGVYTIQAATRPPGGASFSAPTTLHTAASSVIPQDVRVAIGPGGDIVVTWNEVDPNSPFRDPETHCGVNPAPPFNQLNCPNPSFMLASVRPAGGAFTEAQRLSSPLSEPPKGEPALEEWAIAESAKTASRARPAMDSAGNATVIFSYFDGEHDVVESTQRVAGGEFSAPVPISEPGEDSGQGELGIDAAGSATASWLRDGSSSRVVQVATKMQLGAFGPPADVSPSGEVSERPLLDVAPGGGATVAWRLATFTGGILQASSRPPGGSFSAPVDLSNGKDGPLFHEVAVSDQGDSIVAWSGDNGGSQIVRAAISPSGTDAFAPPVAISETSGELFHPVPVMNATGDATVLWTRSNGLHRIVQAAGYDADPPLLAGVSVPSHATVAQPLPFSAVGGDVWPVGAPVFDFGDGSVAVGTAVSHAFGTPGTQTVTVAVGDAGGRTTATTRSVVVAARNFFKVRKLKRNRRKGTATLVILVPEPGRLTVNGRWVKRVGKRVGAGTAKLPVKAAGKGLRRLKRKGRLKVRLRIVYLPVGGEANSKRRRVALRRVARKRRARSSGHR